MHIELIGKKQHYSLDFEGKFNVISGLSGSKKTAFVKLLNKYKQGVHSITLNATVNSMRLGKDQIEVFSNERSIVGDIEAYFQSFDHHLVIIDESSELFRRKDIGHILKKSNNYFVLISRAVGWLPISVDSVYQLVDENHVIINRALYCTANNELTTIINPIEYILTEDGMSSRLFFMNWFKNIKVCDKTFCYKGKNTQRNNSLLHVALEEELLRYNYLLVVFDASAYGYYYPLLCDVIQNSKKKVSLISWDSFENYILQVEENDTPQFFEYAKGIINTILNRQSLEVDGITGATYSSKGIQNAVYDALQNAVISGELKITDIQISNSRGHGKPHHRPEH